MKTINIPNRAVWERREFLKSRKALADYEQKPYEPHIFCSHCKKVIEDLTINVVDFGKQVACKTCFTKKWAKIRVRIGKFPVPENLQDLFEDDKDLLQDDLNKQIEQDLGKAKEAQEREIARIRSKEDPTTP